MNLNAWWQALNHRLWETDVETLPKWQRLAIRLGRIVYVMVNDFQDGQLMLHATSLAYTTLLSLVPTLAVSFSILKSFGVHNQVAPILFKILEPLGEEGEIMGQQIIGFVENVNVSVLGAVGFVFLFYTAVSMVLKIEDALNFIWHVDRPQSLISRFSKYLSVLLVGPVLIFSAIALSAQVEGSALVQTLMAVEPFGTLFALFAASLPYLLIIAALTFFYIFIPNTSVGLTAALTGGVVAGLLWKIIGSLFTTTVVSVTSYTAIYSGFAIVLIFMIWVYINWLILLVGGRIAFYQYHPEYLTAGRHNYELSNSAKEKFALAVMLLVAQHFYEQRPGWTLEKLAKSLRVPMSSLRTVLSALEKGKILARSGGERGTYLPARPLETTSVIDVLEVVRTDVPGARIRPRRIPALDEVTELMSQADNAIAATLGDVTLKSLALRSHEAEPPNLPVLKSQSQQ